MSNVLFMLRLWLCFRNVRQRTACTVYIEQNAPHLFIWANLTAGIQLASSGGYLDMLKYTFSSLGTLVVAVVRCFLLPLLYESFRSSLSIQYEADTGGFPPAYNNNVRLYLLEELEWLDFLNVTVEENTTHWHEGHSIHWLLLLCPVRVGY